MFFLQRTLQYRPDATRIAPAAAGLAVAEEIGLRTDDGMNIVAWWIPPRSDSAPVYLYFHGNAGNLARRAARLAAMARSGAGVFAPSWRGYSGSGGSPSETGFHADARAAYTWLNERISADRIVIFGESIGTGVAVKIAAKQKARALILDSPFESALTLAQARYPWLPVSLLMRDPFRSDLAAPDITMPVFIAHCRQDHVVPLESGQRLARLFRSFVQFEVYDSACHPVPYDRFIAAKEMFLSRHGLLRP